MRGVPELGDGRNGRPTRGGAGAVRGVAGCVLSFGSGVQMKRAVGGVEETLGDSRLTRLIDGDMSSSIF